MGTNQKITATFSEPMDSASVVASRTFTVTGPGVTAVAGTVTYDATNNTAIFSPTGGTFATSTLFTATITTAAESAALLPLASDFIWTFTTGASTDTTAPLVSSTNPVDTAVGAAINQKIVATFDEGMASTTLTAATFKLTAPGPVAVPGTLTYSTIGSSATFTPSSVLAANTTYTATITTGAKDLSGNPLASDFTWSFTTGATTDTTAPAVASTNPADLALGVGIDAAVSATFDKAMDSSTLNPATVTVTGPGATVVVGKVSYDVPDQIVTFTPTSALAASTTFTATIDEAADLSGNMLPTFVWTFTTGSTTTGLSSIDLGAATNFAVLAQASVTNSNASVVNGDLGVTPSGSLTGFLPGVVHGTIQINNAPAAAALTSLTSAYNTAAGLAGPTIVAENLATQVLLPGLYEASAHSFEITSGNLTLNANGDPNAVWVFQMPASTLTLTTPTCSVILENGAQASNIFWQVGSSANIGAACVLQGSILANTSATIAAGATVNGRVLAGAINATGAVSTDDNPISLPGCN